MIRDEESVTTGRGGLADSESTNSVAQRKKNHEAQRKEENKNVKSNSLTECTVWRALTCRWILPSAADVTFRVVVSFKGKLAAAAAATAASAAGCVGRGTG